MAVKTITIDMEAYNLLAGEKRTDESFSKTIKRMVRTNKKTASSFMKNLEALVLNEDSLVNIEKIIKSRDDEIISSEPLNSESE